MRQTDRSRQLFETARRLIPGGVNSPVRAFGAVGGQPVFIQRGEGAYLYDVDGNQYIDYVLSWGPLILGHADPSVTEALAQAAAAGTSYGAPSELEIELARMIMEFMPGIEMIRFVNSGTEATMSALRLARAFTGRTQIVKFDGCYHGHADMLLVKAGSGVATLGLPDSPGVPPGAVRDTLVAGYNNLESVQKLFQAQSEQIAAVIVEPVAGNMGVVAPVSGFLEGLRELTAREGALLIFDEVMTGFRVAPGGAQGLYNVTPDLTTLGKVIGGGLPVGAYGGKVEIMGMVAPAGPMYQAGTLSGNPLAMTAGIQTLKQLRDEAIWQRMEADLITLTEGLGALARERGIPLQLAQVGTMFCAFFAEELPLDWEGVKTCDTERFASYFREMLSHGIYLAPSQFEAGFISAAHRDREVQATLQAARGALESIKNSAA
ncbi:MAG: glutamate-1-semialdehyde 2,1-aminomutase [Chloroflexi bacterium]|nr:glutamate-1-semialdehyde 2,1-aminomutase [Chloroflexota bacterium]